MQTGNYNALGKSDIVRARRTSFTDWLLRGAVAFVFVSIGWEKLTATPGSMWFTLFAHIGWGQWFRCFTGGVQILGGVLMIIPRSTIIGTLLLASTMAGAILFHLFVLGDPFSSAIPAVLLVGILVIGTRRSSETDEITSLGI